MYEENIIQRRVLGQMVVMERESSTPPKLSQESGNVIFSKYDKS